MHILTRPCIRQSITIPDLAMYKSNYLYIIRVSINASMHESSHSYQFTHSCINPCILASIHRYINPSSWTWINSCIRQTIHPYTNQSLSMHCIIRTLIQASIHHLFLHQSICASIYIFKHQSIHANINPPTCIPIDRCIPTSIYTSSSNPSFHQSIHPMHQSIYPYINPHLCINISSHVSMNMYQPMHLDMNLYICINPSSMHLFMHHCINPYVYQSIQAHMNQSIPPTIYPYVDHNPSMHNIIRAWIDASMHHLSPYQSMHVSIYRFKH